MFGAVVWACHMVTKWLTWEHRQPTGNGSPKPLYNIVLYNMVWQVAWIRVGPQTPFFQYNYAFYSLYKMVWIACTQIGLDTKNSIIKRLRPLLNLRSKTWKRPKNIKTRLPYPYLEPYNTTEEGKHRRISADPKNRKYSAHKKALWHFYLFTLIFSPIHKADSGGSWTFSFVISSAPKALLMS